MRQFPVCTVNV